MSCFLPNEVHIDNGAELRNIKIAALRINLIKDKYSGVQTPKSKGQIEIFNAKMKNMLSSIMRFNRTFRLIR